MPSRDDVLRMVAAGKSYEDIGAALRVPPGQAYLLATGLPADGSDSLTERDRRRPGFLPTSTQHLVNPTQGSPSHRDAVLSWTRQRATGDSGMHQAACRRDSAPPASTRRRGDEPPDVIGELSHDHNMLRRLAQDMIRIPGHGKGGSSVHIARRMKLARQLNAALARHQASEHDHLWPAVREVLPDGAQQADAAAERDRDDQRLFASLADADAGSARFDELVADLALRVRRHAAVEDRVFLELAPLLPETRRRELGEQVAATEPRRTAGPAEGT